MSDPTRVIASALAFAAVFSCMPFALSQERVALSPKDGHPLVATVAKPAGTPKGGVVLLPTARSARVAYDVLLPRFAQAGVLAIAIDPRPDLVQVESASSRAVEASGSILDLGCALDLAVERGAPVDRLAIVAAGSGVNVALQYAARTGTRIKALALLSPGRDAPLPPSDTLATIAQRAMLVLATEDEAAKGANALKEAFPAAEVTLLPDRLAFGTGMFGKVTGIESTITDWIARALTQPSAIEIPESKLVSIDGDAAASEAAGATIIQVPLGDGTSASVRLTHTPKRLDMGFDIPEPYVRLNEVVVYLDSSGHGGRMIEKSCWRISYNPKNSARKPLLVKRGGLKGFEDTDEKGITCFSRTEEKRRWTAEISLDLARFAPGDFPKAIRLAFQINGQRMSDVRYYPDDAKVPTAPGAWAAANLK